VVSHDVERSHGSNITARFPGKLVVVGSTATGHELSDRGATPLEKDTFLMSKYLNVANSVLVGQFVRPSSMLTALLLVMSMGLGAAGLTWKLPAVWASLLVTMLISLCAALAVVLSVRYRLFLPMAVPVGAALLAHTGLLTYQTFAAQNERRRIRGIFAKLVSPHVVNELLKTEELSLVGARGQVTIFFADVRGFTELTDRSHAQAEEYVRTHHLGPAEAKAYFDQEAQAVLSTINLYLGIIADVIKRREGTLDKYIGDCVMAFWGAPTPNERQALACTRAAIDAQRAIHNLNQQRASQNKLRAQENLRRASHGQPPLPLLDLLTLGTGINTGVVTIGLMGSDAHGLNYTVFGRDVNLASRLEGYSGRGRIIIGEATWLELQRHDAVLAASCIPIELPPTALKGFGTALRVFEVPWKSGGHTETKPLAKETGLPLSSTG
jgi:adenylate cyclase